MISTCPVCPCLRLLAVLLSPVLIAVSVARGDFCVFLLPPLILSRFPQGSVWLCLPAVLSRMDVIGDHG